MTAAITRRRFLAAGAAAAAAAAVGAGAIELGRNGTAHRSASPGSSGSSGSPLGSPGDGVLVLITLYGGNDGLNSVIPYADPAYLGGRPQLGYQPEQVIRLDNRLGLHPALTGLKKLWDAKRLAVVLGVGYPNPNRSHFRSMDIWQSGVPDRAEATGWLGRWLDATGSDPLRALSIGPNLPRLLRGAKTAAAAIPAGNVALPVSGSLSQAFSALNAPAGGAPVLAQHAAQSGRDLLTVVHTVGEILAKVPETAVAGGGQLEPAGSSELGRQLDVVARLVKGGAPTRVYSVSLGGFDTHANEKDNHARLMGELDQAVSAFLAELAHERAAQRLVVVAYSEFGRRVAANASGGTDHGTAAPVFVAGPAVKGGFYGEQPRLDDLDQGDLKFTTDFRSVYATVLAHVLQAEPKDLLGATASPLKFL